MSIKETLERFEKEFGGCLSSIRCNENEDLIELCPQCKIKQFITEEIKLAMEEIKLKDKTFPELESDDFDKGYAKAVEDFSSNINKYFE